MQSKALVLVLLACACGSESPADVAGTYTLSLTVKQVDCQILGGAVGDTSSGVQIVVNQSDSDATAQVQGAAGALLAIALGSAAFTGEVSGNSLDLSINGTTAGSDRTCAFTRNARMQAKLSGDTLAGTVTYAFATNKTADCGARDTCKDVQMFNGTRPPKL
jgi:hypothetical protein